MRDGEERARLFARVLEALNQGRTEDAVASAETLRRRQPDDPAVAQLMAAVALHKGEAADAERWALASLASRSDHYATWLLAARAARALGTEPVALERFRRAAELDRTRPEAAFGAAVIAIALRLEAAPAIVEDIAARFPDQAAGWADVGSALERTEQWELAARAYGVALRTRPSPALCIRLGTALQALGRRGEAAAVYEQALRLDPTSAEAWFKLGVTLQDGRHPERAAEAYRRAIALRPDFAEAHTNLGVVLQQGGDLDAAKQAYGRAITLNPSVFGRIAQALVTAPHGELWMDFAALRAHLSERARLSR